MTSSHAASVTSIPQALTPLTPASSSSLSSSSSIISRQSSCRSTASVQAVPFRTPIRGSAASSAHMSRQNSGGVGRGFDSTGPGALTTSTGISYSSPGSQQHVPVTKRLSEKGTHLLPPAMAGSASMGSKGGSSAGSSVLNGNGATMESSLTNWTAIGDAVNGVPLPPASATLLAEATSGNGEGILRPAASRQDSTASLIVLRKTVQDFKFGDILGEGSYSTVSLVTDKHPPHRSYALKVLDKEHIKREKKTKYVLIERDTLKALDGHPGIVRLYWTFQDQRSLYYVLELAKNGELLKWIKKFGSFSLPCARFYAAQILSAVEHIHSKGVIHRDLKPENILLDDHMRIKVTDFGTAKQLEDNAQDGDAPPKARTRSFVGTPEYVSPEILSEGKESSKSSDYWGFGCILFQMLAGRPPFQARTEYLMFQKIIKLEYEFPPEFPDDAKDLVQKLLVLDPTERLGGTEEGIEAIKRHPFFTSDPGAIDFSTIWKVEPPTLETGIAPPKEVVTGEFVLADSMDSFGAAVDDDNSDFDGRSELRGSSLGHSEESAGLRNGGGASGAVAALTAVRSNGNGHTIASPPEPITKWTGVLLPKELIVLASPILDRSGFINKHRQLILTDYPRLICIKETPTKVTIKNEVILGVVAKPGAKAGGPAVFVKVDMDNDRIFTVKSSQRTIKFEEPSGSAGRWVQELRDAHNRSLAVVSS